MKKNIYIPVVTVLVVVAAALVFVSLHPSKSIAPGPVDNPETLNTALPPLSQTPPENPSPSPTPSGKTMPLPTNPVKGSPEKTATAVFSGEQDGESVDVQVFAIEYNGEAFIPDTLTVKKGDIVEFANHSSGNFWPASSPHPMHTDYPEFDAKKPLGKGQKFTFIMAKEGTWKYHDHLNPAARGSITVQP